MQRNGPLYSEHESLIESIFGFKVGFLQQQIFPLRWILSQHRIGNWLQMRKWSKCVLKHKSGIRSHRFNRNPFQTSQYTSVCACITLSIFISMCVDIYPTIFNAILSIFCGTVCVVDKQTHGVRSLSRQTLNVHSRECT